MTSLRATGSISRERRPVSDPPHQRPGHLDHCDRVRRALQAIAPVALTGLPSRARVSPDGRYGSVTTFVTGDSYATVGSYSTRTDIIDMRTGIDPASTSSQLAVTRDGKPFEATDFNFWGVTFANDGRHFFATLGTGGQTYLIDGDLTTRRADGDRLQRRVPVAVARQHRDRLQAADFRARV